MKKLFIYTFVVGIVLGAAVAVWGVISFKGNAVVQSRRLYVSRNTSYEALLDSLKPSIKHHLAFDIYAQRLELKDKYKVGHYVVRDGMNVIEIVRMLKLGLQTPVNVVINNVRTPQQLAGKLSRQFEADSVEFATLLTDQQLARKLGFASPLTMFSMFLPNTYEFYWTATPEEVVERLRREYKRFWTAERDAQRKRSGLSRVEVMTLASIVNEETRKVDEMPRVAGVYINRLRKGMPLQADPTIKYALQDFGLRRILKKHLKHPSPYNTYINKGLPLSPICMPCVEAVDAVLNFEKHDYLYFCARHTFDGYHNFAKSYSQHLANARLYQKELNKRKIMK